MSQSSAGPNRPSRVEAVRALLLACTFAVLFLALVGIGLALHRHHPEAAVAVQTAALVPGAVPVVLLFRFRHRLKESTPNTATTGADDWQGLALADALRPLPFLVITPLAVGVVVALVAALAGTTTKQAMLDALLAVALCAVPAIAAAAYYGRRARRRFGPPP